MRRSSRTSSAVIESASEQPAPQIGDQHGLVGIEQFRGLGHEMHAGQNDDVGIDVHRLARKGQAVADDVGDAVENLRRLIIMRQDDRVAAAFQRQMASMSRGVNGPLDGGNGVADLGVEFRRARRHRTGGQRRAAASI